MKTFTLNSNKLTFFIILHFKILHLIFFKWIALKWHTLTTVYVWQCVCMYQSMIYNTLMKNYQITNPAGKVIRIKSNKNERKISHWRLLLWNVHAIRLQLRFLMRLTFCGVKTSVRFYFSWWLLKTNKYFNQKKIFDSSLRVTRTEFLIFYSIEIDLSW